MLDSAILPLMSQKATNDTRITPLDSIRTETVLSRLPIHNLAKKGRVDIHITKRNERGEVELNWKVIPNPTIGEPRQLAYKLDTIVINRRLDEAPRPIPEIIYLGSLRDIARELNLGNDTPAVKKALRQNAHLVLVVKIKYLDKEGRQQVAEFENTRYGVIFTGEQLPNGSKADGVYLTLNPPYRQVLNNAPVRPLDYNYLKELTPAAQRFYEIVSYKIFAALKFKLQRAKLPYSEYCTYSAQQQYYDFDHVKKQMYKVHKPHLASGYLTKASFEATTDSDGKPDWVMSYIPGPKARAEFQAFNGKLAKNDDTPDGEWVLPPDTAEASTKDDARDLVQYFHRRFHHDETATPSARDLEFARALIAQYGREKSRFIVEYSQDAADATNYRPDMLVGIRKYVDGAIKKFDTREKHRQEEKQKAQEERLQNQYERYRDHEIDRIKFTISPDELAEMESTIRADLQAEGIKQFAHGLETSRRMDKNLAARAGVLPYEEWRKQQAS